MLIGNPRAQEQLKRLIAGGKTHAIIITGPHGVGKNRLARKAIEWDLGRSLNKNELDVLMLTAAEREGQTIGKQDIAKMLMHLSRKPIEVKKNYVVIEKAEQLTREAGNSLLVSLEEPSGQSLIILVTNNLSSLLSTILSRCLVIRLGRVDRETIIKGLSRAHDDLPQKQLEKIAQLSHGLPERAINLVINKRFRTQIIKINADVLRWSKADLSQRLRITAIYSKDKRLTSLFLNELNHRGFITDKQKILTALGRLDSNVAPKTVLEELSMVR